MDGKALTWPQTAPLADHIRRDGIAQFARVMHSWQDRPDDQFKWGDELEFIVLRRHISNTACDMKEEKRYSLETDASQHLNSLNDKAGSVARWNHEFGSFMIEGTPLYPFTDLSRCLSGDVEESMQSRLDALRKHFGDDHVVVTLSNYPLLGVRGVDQKPAAFDNCITAWQYISDAFINQTHPRFGNLARNIRDRRGSNVDICVPAFKDTNTKEDSIHMDAMTFGMGCCCLQLTFQSKNMQEARHLFDQFVVLAPIALALSAASPAYRGMLADIDCRWRVVSGSVDDRTEEERDPGCAGYIGKSRYASISRYLHQSHADDSFNDLPLKYNERVIQQIDNNYPFIDDQLKMHLAHLFVRDPLVVYDGLIASHADSLEHFNNIQSTNWQTVRFKPPTSPADGWRVEFRPMDIQFTTKQNAALSIWSLLYARVVSRYRLDFCTPISMVDANMERADGRDAVTASRFWFRINGVTAEYSIADIVNHINGYIYEYVREKYGHCQYILDYLQLISDRANGKQETNAATMRRFMLQHAEYRRDSVITQSMSDDFIDYLLSLS